MAASPRTSIDNNQQHHGDQPPSHRHHHQRHHPRPAFDIQVVCSAFANCISDRNSIDLDQYLAGFQELLKFFHQLGTVFKFIASDVESKINLLADYLKDSDCGRHYRTIQLMIDYEKQHQLLADSRRASGSRTLLRLHRALQFVAEFMLHVSRLDDRDGTSHVARDCYQRTLANYHPWYIRKSASLAMLTLPHRNQLVEKAFGKCPRETGEEASKSVSESMAQLSVVADSVYQATQKLFEEHDLLNLP